MKFTDLQNRISLLSTDQKKAFFKHKSVSWSYDFFFNQPEFTNIDETTNIKS